MTSNDYRQFYRCAERCNSELHQVADRLKRERDDEAAVIVEGAIGALGAATQQLLTLWRSQQESQVREVQRGR